MGQISVEPSGFQYDESTEEKSSNNREKNAKYPPGFTVFLHEVMHVLGQEITDERVDGKQVDRAFAVGYKVEKEYDENGRQ